MLLLSVRSGRRFAIDKIYILDFLTTHEHLNICLTTTNHLNQIENASSIEELSIAADISELRW